MSDSHRSPGLFGISIRPGPIFGVELLALCLGLRGAEYALKINRSASRIGGQRDVLRTAETVLVLDVRGPLRHDPRRQVITRKHMIPVLLFASKSCGRPTTDGREFGSTSP